MAQVVSLASIQEIGKDYVCKTHSATSLRAFLSCKTRHVCTAMWRPKGKSNAVGNVLVIKKRLGKEFKHKALSKASILYKHYCISSVSSEWLSSLIFIVRLLLAVPLPACI